MCYIIFEWSLLGLHKVLKVYFYSDTLFCGRTLKEPRDELVNKLCHILAINPFHAIPQENTCSKSTIQTLEKGVKYVQS